MRNGAGAPPERIKLIKVMMIEASAGSVAGESPAAIGIG
jgi:hypothetical protein